MNIYDVAKKAGVSITTVSRVINGSSRVSVKTKDKVQKVMEELHYTPSLIAVGLATNSTRTIGVMVPDVRDSFHAQVAYLIESQMLKKGYNCILCNTTVEPNQKIEYLNMLYSKNVDGIILVGSSYHDKKIDETYKQFKKDIPMVLINAIGVAGTASVICDEAYGIRKALIHIKETGKKRPIFIKDPQMYQHSTFTKESAFIEAMKEIYPEIQEPATYTIEPTIESYEGFLRQAAEESLGMDSVLFTKDECCARFLKAMIKVGLKTPQDLALVGFNNSELTDLTTPSITTIDHRVKAHCDLAADKLLAMISGQEIEAVTYMKPQLVIKETT